MYLKYVSTDRCHLVFTIMGTFQWINRHNVLCFNAINYHYTSVFLLIGYLVKMQQSRKSTFRTLGHENFFSCIIRSRFVLFDSGYSDLYRITPIMNEMGLTEFWDNFLSHFVGSQSLWCGWRSNNRWCLSRDLCHRVVMRHRQGLNYLIVANSSYTIYERNTSYNSVRPKKLTS